MSDKRGLDRRGFLARGLAAASTMLLGGCDDLSDQPWVRRVLDSAETLTRVTQRAILSPQALAREYSEAEISRDFKANGSTDPDDAAYKAHAANGFADWKLDGRRPGRTAARIVACRSPRHAVAHADHPARLRRGLELHRQMEGRAAQRSARDGEAQA